MDASTGLCTAIQIDSILCNESNCDSVKCLARLCGICFRYYSTLHANRCVEYIISKKALDYIMLFARSKEIIYIDNIMHKYTKNKIVIFTYLFSSNRNDEHMDACHAVCIQCYNKSGRSMSIILGNILKKLCTILSVGCIHMGSQKLYPLTDCPFVNFCAFFLCVQ